MADIDDTELKARREYAQLLRLHDRLLVQVQRVLEELTSEQTRAVVKAIRNRTGNLFTGIVLNPTGTLEYVRDGISQGIFTAAPAGFSAAAFHRSMIEAYSQLTAPH